MLLLFLFFSLLCIHVFLFYYLLFIFFWCKFWALHRGIAAILEKAGCDHVKAAAQAEVAFSIDDTKDPSAEATLVGGKFYSDVWVNGGRELAKEIIKKNEKDTHDAREEARRTEEVDERERRIGIIFEF
jgi:hypothetical protein